MALYRRLIQIDRDAHQEDLAHALDTAAWARAHERTELPQALAAAREAVDIFEACESEALSDVLSTLADVLDAMGRALEAANVRRRIEKLAHDQ